MNSAHTASYSYASINDKVKTTKFDKLIHALWTLIHSSNNLIKPLFISLFVF